MRVVVVGATGNIGTAVVRALAADPAVTSILGLARRPPALRVDKVDWAAADIRSDELELPFRGADAVVDLAWSIQPMRRPLETWRTNITGTKRLLKAVATAQIPALIYASSAGAYSPRRDTRPVPETWPTDGWPEAGYTREKAYIERVLDQFAPANPQCRVVRLRPPFVFQRGAATEQRRMFAGPLLPNRLVRPRLIPFVPATPKLRLQAVHADDVAEACRLAILRDVSGPFNIAADPVLDAHLLAELFDARPLRVPPRLLRSAAAVAWHLHLTPVPPQLLDAFLRLPVMDTTRARDELGWNPRFSSLDAVREVIDGVRTAADIDTPALARSASGHLRIREFASGIGGFDPADHETAPRAD
ncbi:NAD-dependent epimerase/dehydratase family protein [Nocardia inohanensis]|uniref:NAD-dependent epimerase/dehydratase family protein n=1 Tax=Nocardia inohanensis TaxID=209246 RepID=UPI0008350D96|nr:NAD-dependent epimerase/dehydratase family protein [Nocardia inohanensis]